MRSSLLLVILPASVAWVVAAAVPALAAGAVLAGGDGAAGPPPDLGAAARPMGALLAVTAGYAALVAGGAVLLGWAPGRWLGAHAGRRAFAPAAALLLLPLLLPAYVIFYTWWQAWPADSALYGWAVTHGHVGLLRRATLVAGLVCWSWPIVSWCVAAGRPFVPAARAELLALDGAGRGRRLVDALRADATGLGLGTLVVFLLAFNNTTCFDLAQISTIGNELRARDALGVPPRAVLAAALPAVALAGIGAALAWRLLATRTPAPAARRAAPGRGTGLLAVATWIVAVGVPIAILARGALRAGDVGTFVDLYGGALARALGAAALTGLLAALVAAGLGALWLQRSRLLRSVGHAQAIGWLLVALVPGTAVALGLEAAYNRGGISIAGLDLDPASAIYRGPTIIVLGLLARAGFTGGLLGLWIAREPAALADRRCLDDAVGLPALARALGPRLRAGAAVAFLLGAVLALGEITVTARIHPPGATPLTTSLLAAMHYQRPETVTLASAALVAAGLGAAVIVAVLVGRPRRRGVTPAVAGLVVLLACLAGCDGSEPSNATPLRPDLVFGGPGLGPGRFSYPRCIAADGEREVVYVIDKTARVQRFGFDGELQASWRMPRKDNGKPTGLSVAPDGRVAVADTHYHRVIVYDPDGNERMRFGRYGEGPGEFIYPTDVAFGPAGRMYVSEYGGNDRIQVFDEDGTWLFGFGAFGQESGAFDRPQSIVFDADGTTLYIADSCNHRIVATDPDGTVLRIFGGAGTDAGRMHYPYGIGVLDDGTLLVAEFGNNRLQRFSADGRSLGRFGRLGTGEGDLRYPWGVAVAGDRTFVLDSGNNRVQVIPTPD